MRRSLHRAAGGDPGEGCGWAWVSGNEKYRQTGAACGGGVMRAFTWKKQPFYVGHPASCPGGGRVQAAGGNAGFERPPIAGETQKSRKAQNSVGGNTGDGVARF